MFNRSANTGPSQKPEYVLKRANDLINSAVGNSADKEKKLALSMLHNVIGAKRKGGQQWTKTYEQVMKRHLELCVDLKDHRTAKDGLHQYRNLCQTVDPNSLEIVIVHLMELSEAKATAARQKADRVALAAAAKVADLDQEETPESIMLSSMTEEVAKDRTDREVVVPWLKFLWENYRAILELLYKNAKLERIYHKTCEKAFKFCLDYERKLEFRRLCEMLRQHFSNLQRMTRTTPRIGWEWTNESIELHLHTRFVQLEVATGLELWNEGFQTVEDIYEIIILGQKMPKPRIMVSYYEKLTKIFWVADSLLFHAYAWFRFYTLSCSSRKDLKQEEKTNMATCVLLAALSIPSTRDNTDPSSLAEEDEIASDKAQQMAKLLDFQANPTRKALLEDIIAKGVLQEVLPEILPIYNILETKFNPLGLVSALKPILAAIRGHNTLSMYVLPLERVAVVRVMQQLSRVYSALKMDFLQRLLAGLEDISFNQIEKIMIDGVSRKQLQVRIDHRNGCLRFGSSGAATSETIETQVALLGKSLNGVAHNLSVSLGSTDKANAAAQARKEYFMKVLDAATHEHQISLERKSLIERRKEELERIQHDRQKEEQRIRDYDEERRRKMDEMRLVEEQRQREEEKKRKLLLRNEILRSQKELERYNVMLTEEALMELTPAARIALITDAKNEALKAKEDEGRRVNDQAKRLDHITRALRIEASEVIAAKYNEQMEIDRQAFQSKILELVEESKKQHTQDLEEKQRLSKIQPLRGPFEEDILAKQRAQYEKRCQALKNKALKDYRDRKVARARKALQDELERKEMEAEAERERQDKEERDRQEMEMAERLRRQREEDEAKEKERELAEEKARKEKMAAMEAARAEAAEAHRNRQKETGVDYPTDNGGDENDDGGGWRKTGPAGTSVPVTSAASGTPSKPMSSLEKLAMGGGGGASGGWQSSRTGASRDVPAPRRGEGGWGEGGGRDSGSRGGDRGGGWGGGSRDAPPPAPVRRGEGWGGDGGGGGGRDGGGNWGGGGRDAPPPPRASDRFAALGSGGGDRDGDRRGDRGGGDGRGGGGRGGDEGGRWGGKPTEEPRKTGDEGGRWRK